MATYYFDVDGVLADFHSVYDAKNRGLSLRYDFIRNLKPFVQNILLVKALIEAGNDVYISTMVANKYTEKARIDWIHEFLPEINDSHIITIMGHGKKHEHMKTKDGILIDDKKTNCNQWKKAGFVAIWLEEKGGKINL